MIQNDTVEPEVVAVPPDGNSDRNLAASIGKNTIFGVMSKIAQIATRLLTVPIVISHLGLDGYGIWAIIGTAGAYMRFGSFGIKSAFQKYVAEATGNGDYESASTLLSTGAAAMAVLSVVGLIPTAILATTSSVGGCAAAVSDLRVRRDIHVGSDHDDFERWSGV